MKYTAPEGRVIIFNNRDVIVASSHDLACNSARDANEYCTRNGDSELPNECNTQGRNCTGTSTCDQGFSAVACALGVLGVTCSSSGNQTFFNAGPYIPQ